MTTTVGVKAMLRLYLKEHIDRDETLQYLSIQIKSTAASAPQRLKDFNKVIDDTTEAFLHEKDSQVVSDHASFLTARGSCLTLEKWCRDHILVLVKMMRQYLGSEVRDAVSQAPTTCGRQEYSDSMLPSKDFPRGHSEYVNATCFALVELQRAVIYGTYESPPPSLHDIEMLLWRDQEEKRLGDSAAAGTSPEEVDENNKVVKPKQIAAAESVREYDNELAQEKRLEQNLKVLEAEQMALSKAIANKKAELETSKASRKQVFVFQAGELPVRTLK